MINQIQNKRYVCDKLPRGRGFDQRIFCADKKTGSAIKFEEDGTVETFRMKCKRFPNNDQECRPLKREKKLGKK